MFVSFHDGVLVPEWGAMQSRLVNMQHVERPLLQPGRLPSVTRVYYIIKVMHLRSDHKREHRKLAWIVKSCVYLYFLRLILQK